MNELKMNKAIPFHSFLKFNIIHFLYTQKEIQIRDRNTETNWNKFLVEAVKQFV